MIFLGCAVGVIVGFALGVFYVRQLLSEACEKAASAKVAYDRANEWMDKSSRRMKEAGDIMERANLTRKHGMQMMQTAESIRRCYEP